MGKPLLYGATTEFLKIFGIQSFDKLPKLHEFNEMESMNENDDAIELIVETKDVQSLQNIEKNNLIIFIEDENTGNIVVKE